MCIHIHVCIKIHIHIYTHVHICVCICMYVCVSVCVNHCAVHPKLNQLLINYTSTKNKTKENQKQPRQTNKKRVCRWWSAKGGGIYTQSSLSIGASTWGKWSPQGHFEWRHSFDMLTQRKHTHKVYALQIPEQRYKVWGKGNPPSQVTSEQQIERRV